MLTVHLASHFLAPNGYVAFSGSSKHFSVEDNKHLLESVCKKTVMQTGLNLSVGRRREKLVFANAATNVILWKTLLTAQNRKENPSANYLEWLPLDQIAILLKLWSAGENRPINGSFVEFRMEGKKVVTADYK